MPRTFRRDSAGIEQLLKQAGFAEATRSAAERIAADVRNRTNSDVVVDQYVTDRAAASVTIRDRRGMGWHVRDRIFDSAAGAQGLEVRSK